MTNSIYQFMVKYHGNWDCIYDAINNYEPTNKKHEQLIINDRYIFITDKNYPEKLKQILLPPFFVFYDGDINLLNENTICVSGKINVNDFTTLMNKNKEKVFCFNANDLDASIYQIAINAGRKLIVICEGGISMFKYDKHPNVLLISEYNNPENYQCALEQTLERLLFAFANKIYLSEIQEDTIRKILVNLLQVRKDIYTSLANQKKLEELKISTENIKFITNSLELL